MIPVFIAASAFGAQNVMAKGQDYFVPFAARGGAFGMEIRGELFDRSLDSIYRIKEVIQQHCLSTVYSVPIELWLPDGKLNQQEIIKAGEEARELGSVFFKASLGHFHPQRSDMNALNELIHELFPLKNGLQFVVENDQTDYGGNLRAMAQFFNDCTAKNIPIGMTFDMGNWHWTGEDPIICAKELASYVVYIHCKKALLKDEKWVSVPLADQEDEEWKKVLSRLPNHVPRAIEFPVVGDDLSEIISKYIKLLGS
jgi:sugar phosphate isomerase/epimerase